MLTRALVLALLLVTALSSVAAQNPLARMADVRRAIVARDSTRALALIDTLGAAVPDHPNVPFLRSHALGLAGRRGEAAAEIRKLLRWDARYARAALRDTTVHMLRAEFPEVDSLARLADQPIATASTWATIDERDLIAEGTAYDPATRSVLIGSLNKYKVVAISPSGGVSDRVAPGSHGLRSVAGIHVDSVRGTLWVTSNSRYDTPTDSTPSSLFGFDARSGVFRRRLTLPTAGPHFLNDVTTGRDGTVYVTDSRAGKIWFAAPGAGELRELAAIGHVVAPNGITVSPDGRLLFVADVDHIRALDVVSGADWRLGVPDSVNVNGIDGLAFVRGSLVAHHPLAFWKIARYELDSTFKRVVRRTILEANTPDSRTSTTGEVVGDDYVFIGNGQIDRMNLRTIDAATMDPIRIYRVRIQ